MNVRMLCGCCLLLVMLLFSSCSAPEAKKMKFFGKGKAFYEKNDLVKAGLEFKNALQIDPKFADAHLMMGMVNLRRGNPRAAYVNFTKAAELDPGKADAQIQLGKLLLMAGERDKAWKKAELVLGKEPKNIDALLLKGEVLLAKKEGSAARAHLEGMLRAGHRMPDVYILLVTAHILEKNAASAEAALREGIAANQGSVPLHLLLAEVCAGSGRDAEAETLIRKAIAMEPGRTDHSFSLANLYWKTGKERQAVELLSRLVAAAQGEEERRRVAGFYAGKGRFADAERELTAGIAVNADSFPLRFDLGELYLKMNRADKTIAVLKECLTLSRDPANPNIIRAKSSLARLCLLRQDLSEAKRYASEVIAESPKNMDAHLTLGEIFLAEGKGSQGVTEFRTVVTDRPGFIHGHIRLAEAHLACREPKLALDTLRNALKTAPESRDVQRAIGRFYVSQKDYRDAAEQLQRILAKNPGDVEVRSDLGDVLLFSGDQQGAEAVYTAIIRDAPKSSLGYVKLGELYGRQGKFDRAVPQLEQALRIDPDNAAPYLSLARVHILGKDHRKAISAYQQVLARQPGLWMAANDLAFLLSENASSQKDLDEALAWANKAREANPREPTIQDTLGWIYYRKGELGRAYGLFNQVVARAPDNPSVNYHLGMVLYRMGKRERAKVYLGKATASRGFFMGRDEAERVLGQL
jgi:tetratricopeptide (TPR) repeat protein